MSGASYHDRLLKTMFSMVSTNLATGLVAVKLGHWKVGQYQLITDSKHLVGPENGIYSFVAVISCVNKLVDKFRISPELPQCRLENDFYAR